LAFATRFDVKEGKRRYYLVAYLVYVIMSTYIVKEWLIQKKHPAGLIQKRPPAHSQSGGVQSQFKLSLVLTDDPRQAGLASWIFDA
jgi:hypothetical protein